jgi:hypothetical protein
MLVGYNGIINLWKLYDLVIEFLAYAVFPHHYYRNNFHLIIHAMLINIGELPLL